MTQTSLLIQNQVLETRIGRDDLDAVTLVHKVSQPVVVRSICDSCTTDILAINLHSRDLDPFRRRWTGHFGSH
ncbi:hypothetical protein PK98_04720 [Croceibacterium mercuriale]|uniref:Uncharacterized protein n=1 Tax=Croceibacterium mercuriale TaxID=1572751 RepID=A0A0B2C1N1_9SPHN|nr:hypothetical protein PK98_04720 [Croceibacterium mercuriale]